MGQIKVINCPMEGLYVIEPTIHNDERGYFMETYNQNDMQKVGLDTNFVQDNQSLSKKGVLRGLHFQKKYPQKKLIRVISGTIFDVVVDIRKSSKTFGRWYGIELNSIGKRQFYISEGFAHGFIVLSAQAEIFYKVTDFYHPDDEGGIAWNSPEIGIKWKNVIGDYKGSASPDSYLLADGCGLTLSEKDKEWKKFNDVML